MLMMMMMMMMMMMRDLLQQLPAQPRPHAEQTAQKGEAARQDKARAQEAESGQLASYG
jgi:hypothetical protein